MATASCALTYVNTYGNAYPESSAAAYHFGYGKAGQRWVTCYKVTMPSYTGTFNNISFSISVNRGTAYPTNKTSTWKIGLDSLGPVYNAAQGLYIDGSQYVKGYYNAEGTYTNTFSGTVTTSTSSFTTTFSSQSSLFSSGSVFYVYFYSGANEYNSIKLTSLSATLTYTSETVTGTNLLVGSSSSNLNTSATINSSTKLLYWRITGLQYQIKEYTGFHLYLNSGFSFTNGQTSAPTGTKIATYGSTTSTATSFTQSFTVPTSSLKIKDPLEALSVVAVAQNAAGYWRIGGSGNSPVARPVYLTPSDWFADNINCSVTSLGQTTATITVKHLVSNSPKYLNYVELSTSSMVDYGTNTYLGTMSGYCSFDSTTSSPVTKTISKTGLNPGTTYKYYPVAYGNTTYTFNKYYGLNQTVEFTTDANYSGTNTSSITSATTATITSTVNSTINLDGYIYYSTSSGLGSRPSTKQAYSNRKITVNLTGLTANKKHDYYFYVYSSESGTLYPIGSTSFTTDASSYTQTITVSSKGITDATINVSTPSPTTNLDGKTYFSINSNSSPVSSLNIIGSGSYNGDIIISSLQPDKSYSLYTYVKSSVTGLYYPTGTVDTFSTLAPNYTADCLVTGIGTDCAYLFATNFSSTNLDGYYVTDIDYGDEVTPEAEIVNHKIGLRESKFVSGLVPGMTYTYYFYVLPSGDKLQKINSLTFTTRSSVVYYGKNLIPHRIYMVRNGRLEGISLSRKGTPEILYLEDGSTITTSDGLVFNTTEGNIDI